MLVNVRPGSVICSVRSSLLLGSKFCLQFEYIPRRLILNDFSDSPFIRFNALVIQSVCHSDLDIDNNVYHKRELTRRKEKAQTKEHLNVKYKCLKRKLIFLFFVVQLFRCCYFFTEAKSSARKTTP
jgi:hypothetical protein